MKPPPPLRSARRGEEQGQIQINARLGQNAAMDLPTEAFTDLPTVDPAVQQRLEQAVQARPVMPSGSGAQTANMPKIDSMAIRYGMDKLTFDWKIDQGEFTFTPGDIEITTAQKNSMTIKYLGGPIYVPKSADPNYEPVDVEA